MTIVLRKSIVSCIAIVMESAFQSGIISASLQVVLDKFAAFALKEICLILGVDDELRKLERHCLELEL